MSIQVESGGNRAVLVPYDEFNLLCHMTKVIKAKDCLKKIGLLLFPCIRQTFSLY